MANGNAARTPVHLWIVGLLSLVWNAGGAYDWLMINLRNAAYLARMGIGTETMQIIDSLPIWALAAWALGVWAGVAGSLLLLLRSCRSVLAFAFSLLCLAANTFTMAGLDLPDEMTTFGMIAMMSVVWSVAVLLLLYAVRMRKGGVLR